MTREEQIDRAWEGTQYKITTDLIEKSFKEGVKWADDHPKSDITNKQEFIEKTLQWLKSHIKFETISYSDLWDESFVKILAMDFPTVDKMEESFRKIMEE